MNNTLTVQTPEGLEIKAIIIDTLESNVKYCVYLGYAQKRLIKIYHSYSNKPVIDKVLCNYVIIPEYDYLLK